ncbi:MAG: CvpA family protein [Brachymonas sp.]|nr:CvpA family protein [Brachymonas sp.]NJS37272.1 CvpA family protein [Brachymonas sp.]
MAALDWIILAVLLLSLILGAWRGLVYEVLSVMGWLAAFIIAQLYAATVGAMLPMSGATEALRYAAGFVLTFIASAFAAGLIAWATKKLIETVGLRPVDRTLGAFFGLLRGVVILLAATTAVLMTPLKDGEWWKQSSGAGALSVALRSIKPLLPEKIGQYIQAEANRQSRES